MSLSLKALLAAAVRHRGLTLVLAAVFAAAGLRALSVLRIEAFPDVTNVQVMAIALWPGQAAEEVERRLTVPIERALTGVPGSRSQRSITSFGLAQVILTFADDVDITVARQQVHERLTGADLPDGASAELGPNDTPVGQIYQYTLEGDAFGAADKRSWQEWTVAKQLARTPGVADVVSFGGLQKEWHVIVDPDALRRHRLDLREVVAAVEAANGATSGGYLSHGQSEFVVRGRGYLRGPGDIAETVIRVDGSVPILVRHVGEVVQGHTPRRGTVARGHAHDSVEGIVLLRRGENPRRVLADLHRRVEAINRDVLPAGLKISAFYDRTRLVDSTLKTVARNLLEGAALVTLVVWLFLRTVKGSLAVVITMPLALAAAFLGLYFAGVPANLLSMGAIDFGILLDGAVILVENVYRRLHQDHPAAEDVPALVTEAASEVLRPVLFSLAIIAAAMMPIFALEQVEGRIFRPMALTYGFALAGALVATCTVTPALTAWLLRRGAMPGRPPPLAQVPAYLRALNWVVARRALVGGAALVVLGLSAVVAGRIGREFLPAMDEGDLHVTVTMPSTVSLAAGQAVLADMREQLLELPEVRDVVTEQGHPEDGTDDEAPNQAKTFVLLHPARAWPRGQTLARLIVQVRATLAATQGVDVHISAPIKDRVEEAISGVRGQIVVKIFGHDLGAIEGHMGEIRRLLEQVPGARDVEIYRAGTSQHLVADVDRGRAARLGLSVRDVEETLEASLAGQLATVLWEDERPVGVRVRLPPPPFGELEQVARLSVPAQEAFVPLRAVADVHWDQGRTQINREDGARFLALKCNIEGRDMGSFVAEAQAKVAAQVALPGGFYATWGGEFENQQRAMARLVTVVPLSLATILVLLAWAFGALMPAVVVLLGLPFAAVGGVWALALAGQALSVSAAVGFITLFGVATMDGVLVVTYMREARRRHPGAGDGPVLAAVAARLRPVLMTALLASLGLVPAAVSSGIGSEVQRPFALVIIGGLVTSTVLTLLLLPILYLGCEALAKGDGGEPGALPRPAG